jgi:prophage maintenance system killer protein
MTEESRPHWVVEGTRLRALHQLALERNHGATGESNPGVVDSASDLALQAAMYAAEADGYSDSDHLVYVSHLIRTIVCDHPFVDGNKRVGWLALCESLAMDGLTVRATQDEAAAFVQEIAGANPGTHMTPRLIGAWLAERVLRRPGRNR